jgi:NAD(P)-dependent dehydrogenase (short-subunit alcohol dehydrogenase family)
MDLTGRVVLLTGAKRIGAVVAETLARAGADVAVVYNRSAREAEETVRIARESGRRGLAIQADLAHPDECRRVVATTIEVLGRVDVLVAMAGLYTATPFSDLSIEIWNQQMDVELRSAFLCAHAAVPAMRRSGGGRIILFSDWLPTSGRPRYPGFLTYYVAKAGLKALTEAMALELAADRILVNAIAPGPILAPPDTTDKELESVADATPVGRWGGEGEIAKAVMFLIDTEFVTGETIRVDGGRHLK